MKQSNIFCWLLLVFILMPITSAVAREADLIGQMRAGNAVLMIRHALAPGFGDPDGFELNDCTTQRNLNETGREQARTIGSWLRSRGIEKAKIYSSQWCRCLETARLMEMGEVTPLRALNSFFERPGDREPNLKALIRFIHENTRPGELIIMVTHQVTISGITNKWADSGHGKLVRPATNGGIDILGELAFDQ